MLNSISELLENPESLPTIIVGAKSGPGKQARRWDCETG
jgi:hypothetical protein